MNLWGKFLLWHQSSKYNALCNKVFHECTKEIEQISLTRERSKGTEKQQNNKTDFGISDDFYCFISFILFFLVGGGRGIEVRRCISVIQKK